MKCLPLLVSALLAAPAAVAAPPSPQTAPSAVEVYRVPYRVADTKHLIVRAKLNGTGPYNFIVDTGAPALFVSAEIADKIGVKANANGWGTFDRLDIEGGATLRKATARIESPAQLRGMNAMGLAGIRIDGVFGFNLLANFKIEIDLTRPKMIWTRQHGLHFVPLSPSEVAAGKAAPTEGITQMENLTKLASTLFARKPPLAAVPRGFFGIELAPPPSPSAVVTRVLVNSPAAAAGFAAGDIIAAAAIGDEPAAEIVDASDLLRQMQAVPAGAKVKFTVKRAGQTRYPAVVAGRGGL